MATVGVKQLISSLLNANQSSTFRNIWFIKQDIQNIPGDGTEASRSLRPSRQRWSTSFWQRRCTRAGNSSQSSTFCRCCRLLYSTYNWSLTIT